jgi:hypothetical protein
VNQGIIANGIRLEKEPLTLEEKMEKAVVKIKALEQELGKLAFALYRKCR